MAAKRKTAAKRKPLPPGHISPPVENDLPMDQRYKVVTPDGQRVYYGDGVSKEEAERLAKDLMTPAIVVPYLDV